MAKLVVVPTPIGNLGDITQRAVTVLSTVDFILSEDTRKTGILLRKLEVQTPMISHHKFNEHKTLDHIIGRIQAGENMALVTDAGTPGISDPGFLLIRACLERGLEIECLPGPTAFVPALVLSGIPCDRFVFEGFLPVKKGREKRFKELSLEHRTMVFYESPHRLLKTINKMIEVFGEDRKASVSRELSKIYEETFRGSLKQVHSHFSKKTVKGEFVIVVAGM